MICPDVFFLPLGSLVQCSFSAIVWANIKEVYYAASIEDAEVINFRDLRIYRHLHGEECILEMKRMESAEVLQLYEEYTDLKKTIY